MRARLSLATACLTFIVACGSTTSSTTPTPQPTPQGPPVAQATLVGDASVAGSLHITDVTCAYPTFKDSTIVANGTNGTPNLAIRLTIGPGSVGVQLDTGSGLSYTERDFSGSGVSNYGASTGATVNSPLHETTAANGKVGTIGSASSITATINCAGQTTGSGSFKLTGTTAQGSVSGQIKVTRVTCSTFNGPGNFVMHAVGMGTIGNQAALIGFFGDTVSSGGHYASVTISPQNSPTSAFFTSTATANVTLSATSAKVDAQITEPYPPKDTLHVTGDATCGSSVNTSG